ncbi:nuclear transport factor 2 family protein [Mannheimia massilioguelmaensis]|uniref:nuclear transport factor 2 family protein n=1 Tax=Mannheimia massilioguelmaensis TaxID=1604354 RepID=UPI0005C9E25A|nr:nuclear transport factor 2 family protein [Mannheimia massilioguelmaensis]
MVAKTSDFNQIVKIFENYTEGTNGDVALLKTTFWEDAIINGSPIEVLYQIVAERGNTNCTMRLDFSDIESPAACGKLIIEDWHGANFVEYMNLIKRNGEWKIVAKVGVPFAK